MKLASLITLIVFCASLMLSGSAPGEVRDVREGLGSFHWEEESSGEGTLKIEPEAPVIAGTTATWTITYTAGPDGLPEGAAVELVTPRGCTPARIGDESVSSVVLAS